VERIPSATQSYHGRLPQLRYSQPRIRPQQPWKGEGGRERERGVHCLLQYIVCCRGGGRDVHCLLQYVVLQHNRRAIMRTALMPCHSASTSLTTCLAPNNANEVQNILFAIARLSTLYVASQHCVTSTTEHYQRQDCRTLSTAGLH
jgi:hypothetical protein